MVKVEPKSYRKLFNNENTIMKIKSKKFPLFFKEDPSNIKTKYYKPPPIQLVTYFVHL